MSALSDLLTLSSIQDKVFQTSAIIVTDAETGVIMYATPLAERLFKYMTAGELKGRPIEDLVAPPVRQLHIEHRADYMADMTRRRPGVGKQVLGYRKDGTTFLAIVSLASVIIDTPASPPSKHCIIATIMEAAPVDH